MDGEQAKKSVLFLSVHNSTRSPMAEALLRDFAGEKFTVFSAGTEPTELNDLAVRSMQEVGIDISHYRSKLVGSLPQQQFDYVVSICTTSSERCPTYPNVGQSFVWNFTNPDQGVGSEEEKLQAFRDFRDAVTQKIQQEIIPLA